MTRQEMRKKLAEAVAGDTVDKDAFAAIIDDIEADYVAAEEAATAAAGTAAELAKVKEQNIALFLRATGTEKEETAPEDLEGQEYVDHFWSELMDDDLK